MAEHNKVGKWGEQHAADVLDREGYTIVETNWSPLWISWFGYRKQVLAHLG